MTDKSVFRAVNDRIAAAAADLGATEVLLFCECADDSCGRLERALLSDHAAARAEPQLALVVTGHEGEDEVVLRRETVAVVRRR